MEIPPGLVYLSKRLPSYAILSTFVYLALHWARNSNVFGFGLPSWVEIVISILARPVFLAWKSVYRGYKDSWTAATLGAEIPPYVGQSIYTTLREWQRMVEKGYPAEVLSRWTRKHGDVLLVPTLSDTVLVTDEPSHVKAILATQFDMFGKSHASQDAMKSLLGTGIFNVNGEMWKFHRSITRPFFTRERISDFEIYERNCNISLKAAERRLAEGHSVDVQDLFGRFTLDSATEFLFGQTVDSLSAELPYPPTYSHKNTAAYHYHPSNVFVKAFSQGLDYTETRIEDMWPLFEFGKDKIKPLRKIMDEFTKPMIEKALSHREKEKGGQSNGKEAETVLSSLVDHTQDEQILKDELINLLVAGRDTTMSLLAFSVYMLAQNPSIELRLRQEIYDVVGPTAAPDYSQIRAMKYMRAFLNEVLRLYPPVPIDSRMAFEDTTFPSTDPTKKPVFVPKHTNCVYSVLNIQRRTDLWGPDALVFDPDRFMDERLHKYLTPNPYIFCPFNAGPRICLGQQFAYHEASYYLTRFLQKFTEFTLDDSANVAPPAEWTHGEGRKPLEKIHPMVHLTMYIKGGLWIRMKEVSDTSKV
ncbi:cytochrome P450 monooxygenase pc-2 [Agrocybe pediades]|nr:cytochrome P450 monooxygenase pc-2 [Agrocybe pediades]